MKVSQSRRQSMKQLVGLIAAVPALGVYSAAAVAAKAPIYTSRSNKLALNGRDAVSYFEQGKAVAGDKAHSLEHEGARWLFASAENKEKFMADPQTFAPQFGGYCAFSVAKGKLFKGDPELWDIENGQLFFNYNKGIHLLWLKRKQLLIARAQANWPDILG